MATTQPDATPHLLAFAARYDADPAGVAAVIAALALVSAHDEATPGRGGARCHRRRRCGRRQARAGGGVVAGNDWNGRLRWDR